MRELTAEILARLAEPFPSEQIDWKPQAIKGERALAVAYIDARTVAERLDEVVSGDWSSSWEPVGKECVKYSLTICGVTRTDAGEPGDGTQGKTLKAAVSDGLKRAAVLFGLGRYLYRLPAQWVDYDPQHKRLKAVPRLPSWALPRETTMEGQATERKRQEQQAPEIKAKKGTELVAKSEPATKPAPREGPLFKNPPLSQEHAQSEQPLGDDEPEAESCPQSHWMEDPNKRATFWATVRKVGLEKPDVHMEWGVDSMKKTEASYDQSMALLKVIEYGLEFDIGLVGIHAATNTVRIVNLLGSGMNFKEIKARIDAYVEELAADQDARDTIPTAADAENIPELEY